MATKSGTSGDRPSRMARRVANHALFTYAENMVDTLAALIAFRTVTTPGVPNPEHPEFRRLKDYLAELARSLGLDYADHDAAVVIGTGTAQERLGLLTHADVRPADPDAWRTDPFTLDRDSEPGRLLGRGVEDDKGAIATALYAMKAIVDHGLPRRRRVELIVSLTEESDWSPFREFLARWTAPDLNIAFDALYPVVTAERGTGAIHVTFCPNRPHAETTTPRLMSFRGGDFLAQIPAEAEALIVSADPRTVEILRERTNRTTEVGFDLTQDRDSLTIQAHGAAAHSSTPANGRNAITHLAALLGDYPWPRSPAASLVRFINDLVGLGHYAERFGALPYTHEFMGPLTLALTTVSLREDGGQIAGLNVRRPTGRSRTVVERTIRDTLETWKRDTGTSLDYTVDIGDPYYLESAPHIPVLLNVFGFYTGRPETRPIAVGGGTQARLLPNGVNFGPAMPDEPYTGHSNHEFMTLDRLHLNLQMYAALLVELTD